MMKCVILAGGYGTRISDFDNKESILRPKPMIEIGGKPILWHLLKIYSNYCFNDFIICCGYKGEQIKEYFNNTDSAPWNIEMVDTGLNTMTGGRLKRIQNHIDDTFCVTYGDGLSDININDLIKFHNDKKSTATLTAVHPPERFGVLSLNGDHVTQFREKPSGNDSWVNGGFLVCETEIFNYLQDDSTILEKKPLESLSKENKLTAFKHDGFWYAMDTLRERKYLEKLYESGNAPWKTW